MRKQKTDDEIMAERAEQLRQNELPPPNLIPFPPDPTPNSFVDPFEKQRLAIDQGEAMAHRLYFLQRNDKWEAERMEQQRHKQEWKRALVALGVSAVLIAVLEVLVYYLPWNWLKNHPHSLGIRIGSGFVILFSILWLFKPKLWKYWLATLISFVILVVSLLG